MVSSNLPLALLLVVGVAAVAVSGKFLPTKTGAEFPEFFWFRDDFGRVLPVLLHGLKPEEKEPRAIEDDVKFWIYNSKDTTTEHEIYPGCWACLEPIVRGKKVVILVHGFSSSHLGGFGDTFRAGFAQSDEEYNLIFVNWEKLAAAPWYETAANNVRPVGIYTATLIEFLVSSGAVAMADIIFAGHSLGSHHANFISSNLVGRLPVVHALDPALPLFGERPDYERIDPEDGDFVNVVHSSMGTLLDGGLAFTEPRGHIDFYPNSGKNQPGCGSDYFGACSHSRAYEYFAETAWAPNGFSSCECESWEEYSAGTCTCATTSVMGIATPTSHRGIRYLRTHGNPPYGIDTQA